MTLLKEFEGNIIRIEGHFKIKVMYQLKEKKQNESQPLIQTSLKIGQPGDKYEQEADRVADQVMRMSNADTMQMQPIEEEEEELMQPKIQMQPMEEEEELQPMIQMQSIAKEELVQPKSNEGRRFATSEINRQISSSKGSGKSLSSETNQIMSKAFNMDLGNVKIHTGTNAEQMNNDLNAKAFTHGSDIYFGKDEYDPSSLAGKKLLAHELTHVVQHSGRLGINKLSNELRMNAIENLSQINNSNIPEIQKDAGLTVSIIGLLLSAGTWAAGQGSNLMTVDPRLQRIAEANADRETYRRAHPFRTQSWSFFDITGFSGLVLDSRWEVDLRWQYNGSELTDVHMAQGWEDFFPGDTTHAKLIMVDNQASNKKIGFRCEFEWNPVGPGDGVYQCEGWISADGSAHRSGWQWHSY